MPAFTDLDNAALNALYSFLESSGNVAAAPPRRR
jgi:hypothetical protein